MIDMAKALPKKIMRNQAAKRVHPWNPGLGPFQPPNLLIVRVDRSTKIHVNLLKDMNSRLISY